MKQRDFKIKRTRTRRKTDNCCKTENSEIHRFISHSGRIIRVTSPR